MGCEQDEAQCEALYATLPLTTYQLITPPIQNSQLKTSNQQAQQYKTKENRKAAQAQCEAAGRARFASVLTFCCNGGGFIPGGITCHMLFKRDNYL